MPNSTPSGTSLYSGEEGRVRLRRIAVKNYKSVGSCDVDIGRLTILVGRNGAGKSNFLDALRFVADALQTSLDHAIQSRGGIDDVRRRSTGHPRNVHIQLDWELPGFRLARYKFEIAARKKGAFAVKTEQLRITNTADESVGNFMVQDGTVVSGSVATMPPGYPDRLYLVAASGMPEFRPAYDALVAMGFYNLNPEAMKELQSPDAGEMLHRDGANIASVIARLADDKPHIIERVNEYLAQIVPDISAFGRVALGPKETLQFRQKVKGAKHPWKFYAANMSDGTLRALGTLTAVMQLAKQNKAVSVVGIEEPETALHPAAAGALMDALRESSSQTQVVLTSHSPDLLDQFDSETETLLVVEARQGTTHVTPPDHASWQAIRDHLYSPGELLRMDQLEVDETVVSTQQEQYQLPLDSGEDQAS